MLRIPLALAVLLLASPAAARDRPHPDVGPADASGDACQGCHATRTPEIVKQWEAGTHGLMLVKCFVCHGSTGKDFVGHAAPSRCDGCHAAEVASVVPAKRSRKAKAADCFDCHSPHDLAVREGAANPHGAR